MAKWTEDTAAILLGFVIIALALAAFLVAPFDEVNASLVVAQSRAGFSVDAWSEANDSGNPAATARRFVPR